MTAVSTKAYAKHRGVSVSAAVKWKKLGRVLVLPSGKIHLEKSDVLLDSRPQVYRGGVIGGTPAGGGGSPQNAATKQAIEMKEYYAGLTKKLEYERLAEKLCDVDLIKPEVAREYDRARERIMRVSSEVTPLLLALGTPRNPEACKAIIDTAMIRALDELAGEADDDD
jgi:hypothetical protein